MERVVARLRDDAIDDLDIGVRAEPARDGLLGSSRSFAFVAEKTLTPVNCPIALSRSLASPAAARSTPKSIADAFFTVKHAAADNT